MSEEAKETERELAKLQKAFGEARYLTLGALFPQLVHNLGNILSNLHMRAELLVRDSEPNSQSNELASGMMEKIRTLAGELNQWSRWSETSQRMPQDPIEIDRELALFFMPVNSVLVNQKVRLELNIPSKTVPFTFYQKIEGMLGVILQVVFNHRPPCPCALVVEVTDSGKVQVVLNGEPSPLLGSREEAWSYLKNLIILLEEMGLPSEGALSEEGLFLKIPLASISA